MLEWIRLSNKNDSGNSEASRHYQDFSADKLLVAWSCTYVVCSCLDSVNHTSGSETVALVGGSE